MTDEFISIDVYTDGSTNNYVDIPFGLAGCGVFIPEKLGINDQVKVNQEITGIGINTTELLAIKLGLSIVSKILTEEQIQKTTVNLYSDSKNCINSLTKLYKTWIKNQNQGKWIKSNGEEVDNQDIYESILEIKKSFLKVNFIHVNSHTGIEGNEEADKLAKEAVSSLYEKIKKRNSNAKTKL